MSKRLNYAAENMQLALVAVRNGASQRAASRQYGVPRGTLQDKLAGRVPEVRKMGPGTVLTEAEETDLATWILEMSKAGFPRKKTDVINTVMKIVKDDGRKTPFRDDRPGETWFKAFMRRHPQISNRTAETVNKARAGVTEENLRKWFKGIEEFLLMEGHRDILDDGSRIINADETNFQMCPKSGKILGPRGWKNIYEIASGKEKETLTVLGTFNANGQSLKGMIVYPYTRPPKDLVNSVPDSWAIGLSDSGWMKSETFYEYVANVLHPWLSEHHVKLPVLFIVDGHKTHLTYHLSEFCSQHGIILYCLFPNATHILQPADVSVFRPLKLQWKKHVRTWQNEHPGKALSRKDFAPLLDKALNSVSTEAIANGFKACGLFPFNPDAVDYSKCLTESHQEHIPPNSSESGLASETSDDIGDFRIALSVIQKLLDEGHEKNVDMLLDTLRTKCNEVHVGNNSPVASLQVEPVTTSQLSPRSIMADWDADLASIDPLNPDEEAVMSAVDMAVETIIQTTQQSTEITNSPVYIQDTTVTKSISDESAEWGADFPNILVDNPSTKTLTGEDVVIAETDIDGFLLQVSQNNARENSKTRGESSHVIDMHPSRDTSVSPAFSKHLFWPTANSDVKKKETKSKRKLPYAVSSAEWQKMYREKEEEAQAQQEAKRKKKEDKENKKKVKTGQKHNKGSKSLPTSAQGSVATNNDVTECPVTEQTDDAPCLYCGEYFSQSKGGESWIQCFMCAYWAHENCAGTSSETSFMCELCGNK